jgi:acetamidase/formamidase
MMNRVLETTHRQDGGGTGLVLSGVHVVARIDWGSVCKGSGTCVEGADEGDVIGLTIARMENKAKAGMGSAAESKALILLHQAKAELSGGQKTLDDGTPIFGGSP